MRPHRQPLRRSPAHAAAQTGHLLGRVPTGRALRAATLRSKRVGELLPPGTVTQAQAIAAKGAVLHLCGRLRRSVLPGNDIDDASQTRQALEEGSARAHHLYPLHFGGREEIGQLVKLPLPGPVHRVFRIGILLTAHRKELLHLPPPGLHPGTRHLLQRLDDGRGPPPPDSLSVHRRNRQFESRRLLRRGRHHIPPALVGHLYRVHDVDSIRSYRPPLLLAGHRLSTGCTAAQMEKHKNGSTYPRSHRIAYVIRFSIT